MGISAIAFITNITLVVSQVLRVSIDDYSKSIMQYIEMNTIPGLTRITKQHLGPSIAWLPRYLFTPLANRF